MRAMNDASKMNAAFDFDRYDRIRPLRWNFWTSACCRCR